MPISLQTSQVSCLDHYCNVFVGGGWEGGREGGGGGGGREGGREEDDDGSLSFLF